MTPETIDTIPTTVEHRHVAGWGGVAGECGVECACGVTYDGFDTLAEAGAMLDRHIASEGGTPDDAPEPEPECTHQAGCPRHGTVEDCDPAPAPTPEEIARHAEAKRRHEYIAGLRELADLLQGHPELILPYDGSGTEMLIMPSTGREREELAAWAKVLPGTKRKEVRDSYFDLYGQIRGLRLQVICHRDEVCEKIVTGTRKVTKTVRDPEALAAVPLVEVTETVEDVRWECRPVLDGDR